MRLMMVTKDGKLPKNRWVVLPSAGGRPIAQIRFKSSAIDRALTASRRSGAKMAVCNIDIDHHGYPALYEQMIVRPDGSSSKV